eukprot:6712511-Pyramimonas_sp.AAC.1
MRASLKLQVQVRSCRFCFEPLSSPAQPESSDPRRVTSTTVRSKVVLAPTHSASEPARCLGIF